MGATYEYVLNARAGGRGRSRMATIHWIPGVHKKGLLRHANLSAHKGSSGLVFDALRPPDLKHKIIFVDDHICRFPKPVLSLVSSRNLSIY